MHLDFSKDELEFRSEVRALILAEFPDGPPTVLDPAAEARWLATLRDRGWAAYKWPREYGGPGWSVTKKYIWERETLSAGLPAEAGGMGMSMLAPVLWTYGSPEQQRRFLPDILSNRTVWCQGYSEPGAGSDLAALRMRAVRDGGHYVVDGEKTWTSGAHRADMMFTLVRTSTGARRQQGITFLLIDLRSPGVTIRPIITLDGRHAFNSVVLDGVRVPVGNRIGEEDQGWTYAKGLLAHERTGQAFVTESLLRLRRLKDYARNHAGGARSLMDDAVFRGKVAAVEVELLALEYSELRTLAETASGHSPGVQSSVLKLKGTQVIQRITELAIECAAWLGLPYPPEGLGDAHGRAGSSWCQDNVALYLFARSASIAGGSDEIQRDIIARHVLALPR